MHLRTFDFSTAEHVRGILVHMLIFTWLAHKLPTIYGSSTFITLCTTFLYLHHLLNPIKTAHNFSASIFLKSTLLILTALRYRPLRCSISFTDILSALLTSTIRAIYPAQRLSYFKPSWEYVMKILI